MIIPQTIAEAIEEISNVSGKELKTFKREDLINLHHRLGRYIRNNFGMWSGKNEKLCIEIMKTKGEKSIPHPDDMSQFLIEKTWEKLNTE